MVAGLVLMGPVAAVHAEDPPAPPVALQDTSSYGPAVNPSVGSDTPVVNPGSEVRVTGANFCANTTVVASIAPTLSGFPKNLTSDGSGNVSLKYTAPAGVGPYTVTFTGQSVEAGCTKSGNTVITVVAAASAGPVPGQNVSGNLPSTGSSTAGLQLRNAVVALFAGLGMVLVASRRRKATAATVSVD